MASYGYLSGMSSADLEKRAAQNSADWHTDVGQRKNYEAENKAIKAELDKRNGTQSSFDSTSGKWSTTGGTKGSSGSSGGSSGSGSSGGKSSGGSTPSWLEKLTSAAAAGGSAGKTLGGLPGGMAGGLAGAIAGLAGSAAGGLTGGGGGNVYSGSSPSSAKNPYATDDWGNTDFSVLLRDAMRSGASGQEVQRLLDGRLKKALGDDALRQYAYDDTYAQAMEYINYQKIMDQLGSYSPPTYTPSEWERTADALARAALEMQYDDWTKTDQYAALAERYGLQGQMGMQDVLGQVSSRTGGLSSSYAATVAQQQYNQYMSQLEQTAREMYAGERSDAIQNAQLAYQYSDRDYQRYLDQLSQYNAERSYGFDVLSQALSQSRYNREWQNMLEQQEYQKQQNSLAADQWQQSFDQLQAANEYERRQLEQADARDRIGYILAQTGGSLESVDPILLEKAQLTDADLEAMVRQWNMSQPQPRALSYTAQRAPVATKQTDAQKDQPPEEKQRSKAFEETVKKISAIEDGAYSNGMKVNQIIDMVKLAQTQKGLSLEEAKEILSWFGLQA